MKITIDTNILPIEDLRAICNEKHWDLAVVTVTESELNGTDLRVDLDALGLVYETGIYGESNYGKAVYGSKTADEEINNILTIISGGSFPKKDAILTPGQKRQFRDAMIFHAHIRDKRDIFITNDKRGFIKDGRREKLQGTFGSRIMTRNEFLIFCQNSENR